MKKFFMIGLIIFGSLMLSGCNLISSIEFEEYQAYLENEYGKDKEFYMVEEGTCNWFELGYCSYLFSSNDLNGETFYISGKFSEGKKVFEDNYVSAKYKERLEDKYSIYFDKIIRKNFEISLFISDDYNIPLISFEEYENLITNKEVKVYLQPNHKLDKDNKYFHLKTTDDSIEDYDLEEAEKEMEKFIYNNFNIDLLKHDVKEIIQLNNLNNVSKVLFDYYDCEEDEYVISCGKLLELYKK